MEKLYYQTDKLQEKLNWDVLMDLPRYAGGHDDQMTNLFKDATLIAHWNEGDYQGSVATCMYIKDFGYAIYNDYYGSCSGCDAWESASDEEVRHMCIGLSNGAYIFEHIDDVIKYLNNDRDNYAWNGMSGVNLLEEIYKNITVIREMKINKIIG